jgi:hypothetical protein
LSALVVGDRLGRLLDDLRIAQAGPRKIFRSARRANHLYNLARLALDPRGVAHRHECWRGMRWTLSAQLTSAPKADSEAVWF